MAKAKKKTSSKKIQGLVTLLLDRTSSMSSVKAQTIEAFNAYIATLQKEAGDMLFNLIQFDSISIDKVHTNLPIKDVAQLTDATYHPRGSTPLIDAAYKTIKAVEKAVSEMAKPPKVVISIQTDGEENCSTEHTWEELNALIKEKTKAGWEFNFMGCGIDAYQQGSRMGISVSNTVSYGKDRRQTMAMFQAAASNTASFSRGLSSSTGYSVDQKLAAGDIYDPSVATGVQALGVPVIPVTPPPVQRVSKKKQPKIVDDITL